MGSTAGSITFTTKGKGGKAVLNFSCPGEGNNKFELQNGNEIENIHCEVIKFTPSGSPMIGIIKCTDY